MPSRAPDAVETTPRCPCAGGCPRCSGTAHSRLHVPGGGPGRPLDAGLRRSMEAGFGTSLSDVRVHTDPASAEAVRARRARALTMGRDVFFAPGAWAPATGAGRRLLAHELAHVLQQRRGNPAGEPVAAAYDAAEREGRAAAGTVAGGGRFRPERRAAGLVQHQDADAGSSPVFSDRPEFQLQLDPEIEAMMLRHHLRWWLGITLAGDVPSPDAAGGDEGSTAGVPSPDLDLAPTPSAPGSDMPDLPSGIFDPIDPEVLAIGEDVGGVLAPYNLRGVPLGARDVDAALEVYRRNAGFVSLLPDLRDLAPDFLRPIIPDDWRRSIAVGLTSATLNAQLRGDWPTPLEAADESFLRLTGVSTTYLPLPSISF